MMNLVCLSDEDFDGIYDRFCEFHAEYSSFFQTQTKSVAKPAKDYLHGQLFTQQQMNMVQYCREVPNSEYEAMQHFISASPWKDERLKIRVQSDVCRLLGASTDGALILDESGIPKQGKMSVGVGRQYCGCLGKVDNCQVGVYLSYVNAHHSSLVDFRLYLPQSWISDEHRRCKCGVPQEVVFQTKAQLGLQMIRAFVKGGLLFGWVSMDCHYGEQPWLLKTLADEGICYMADIPCDTHIFLDRPHTEIPQRKGNRGRLPTKQRLAEGQSLPIEVRQWAQTLEESDWSRLSVRETERGWLMADFAAFRVWHAVENLPFQQVWLVLRRPVGEPSTIRFSFSNAPDDTSLSRLAQMQCRRYWVERAFEDAKGEAGLDQYQVRGWTGWHHHMTLTLLAMLFLLQLTIQLRPRAPMLTLQDTREILEAFLPRKSYSPHDFIELLRQKHKTRLSARQSHAKKQKQRLDDS